MRKPHALIAALVTAVGFSVGGAAHPAAQNARLIVSVATSMFEALQEIAGLYKQDRGVTVNLNTGGSNTLGRQIVEGARVAVFISADEAQMDVVENAGRLVPSTRVRLLTNELAVVVPLEPPSSLTAQQLLAGRVNRLAMGEPSAVPAGVYGRRWLEHEGAWAAVQSKVVPFPTVRAVLAAVEAGRVDGGIVYRTDVKASTAVRVLLQISSKEHAYLNIVQPAAVVAGPFEAEGRRFLAYLQGTKARAAFTRHGFGLP
ncbi:MAG: molybdate ABC transporter substrate-binding protein [Vicinamibacterales bacterium]